VTSLGIVSLAGGILGGLLLVRTSDDAFLRLLPWLLLIAAATFSFGGTIQRLLERPGGVGRRAPVIVFQFLIAVYGGYFGGGMGIMMLAALTIAGMKDIHEMNAVKSVLAVAINGVALAEFVALGAIAWAPGLIMMAGGIAGGYAGAATARRVNPRFVRVLVTVIAWGMTIVFFLR